MLLLKLNRWLNAIRARLGLPYWSLSQYLKHQVKNAVNFISDFEHVMTEEARRRGCDGVVCGHIHKAEIREIDGVLYCNDGDWVESLTALVETFDGELQLIDWRSRLEAPLNLGRIADELPSAVEGMAHEDRAGDGCLGAAGQRRRAHAEDHRARAGSDGSQGGVLTPLEFRTLPCPTYPGDPPVALPGRQGRRAALAEFEPDAMHIATEGPLGLAARRFALRTGIPFTTAYHTRFPEYVQARIGCRCRGPTRACAGSTGRRRR